jgi:large subunit ribosomal protein L15
MKLNELKDRPGAREARKRVGRGLGSGLGKTAGRGGKGQTARSGGGKPGFEGGQMPIYRRLPKRGFNKPNRDRFNEVNLGRIQMALDAGKLDAAQPVTPQALLAAGVISRAFDGVRLLGQGELKAKLSFQVHHASKSAVAAVEKLGGSVALVETRKAQAAQDAGSGE